MKAVFNLCFWFTFFTFSFIANAQQKSENEIPHLKTQGTATQLIVNGKPLLMLAGELGNSSASNVEYMRPVWANLVKMNLNTVLVPAYWELIEPMEGKYDFSLIDSLILNARKNNLHIVFLWFGVWKNSMSCYAPLWVKENYKRFTRAVNKEGKAMEILSPFGDENLKADIKVFSMLLKHIREFDSLSQTVVMVQVENEIGMLPDAREYSNAANVMYNSQVPPELLSYFKKHRESLTPEIVKAWGTNGFKTSGSWEEIFGKSDTTEEIFMAWNYGRFIEQLTLAAKREYPLPMYVNAALIRPNYKPGQYPSAGPLPHLFNVWRAAAPDIDFFAPDIYFPDFTNWSDKYKRPDNPLFVPETGGSVHNAITSLYAFGKHDAMGYSPFSIESIGDPENDPLTKCYEMLNQLSPIILEKQGLGQMSGVVLDSIKQVVTLTMGNYTLNIKHQYNWLTAPRDVDPVKSRAGCIIIQITRDEYLVAGKGVVMNFTSAVRDDSIVGIGYIDEVKIENGKMISKLRLNGDQDHQGRHLWLPLDNKFHIQHIMLYRYK
ncbi:MAG TPA: DUF5597 domain-containing protein [Bacteroidales bacterium]